MNSAIESCRIEVTALDPAHAELQVLITLTEPPTDDIQIRGRLMGPRCLYSSTVQIAYPLKPISGGSAKSLRFRVIIPDPSLWDPQSPFWYEGPVELRQGGIVQETWVISLGLRWLQLASSGLRINGRPIVLKGQRITSAKQEDLARWRHAGINLLVAPATVEFEPICTLANQMGFLLLGQLQPGQEPPQWQHHPCLLGWLPLEGPAMEATLPVVFVDAPEVVEQLSGQLWTGHFFLVSPPRQR